LGRFGDALRALRGGPLERFTGALPGGTDAPGGRVTRGGDGAGLRGAGAEDLLGLLARDPLDLLLAGEARGFSRGDDVLRDLATRLGSAPGRPLRRPGG